MVEKKPSKKKETKAKDTKEKKTQQVPPRATEQPTTATKGAPPPQQPPAENLPPLPKFPPEEQDYLKYGYMFLQNLKHRAGFTLEGTVVRYHDIEFISKLATIAVQRTELLNKVIDRLERAENELKVYKEKYGDL